mmetsp:Transcript_88091/g.267169  ORF Transcript_88091/g.267169 Transcript_88091/m.267169 type:complete len:80 (+) Transcript_88091:352-591(+)
MRLRMQPVSCPGYPCLEESAWLLEIATSDEPAAQLHALSGPLFPADGPLCQRPHKHVSDHLSGPPIHRRLRIQPVPCPG